MELETFLNKFALLTDTPNGVQKLRELILQLAVQGKLVPQDPNDEPASVLLKRLEVEKKRLVEEGKVRKPYKSPPIEANEIPFELPQEWEWVRIGEIRCQVTDGVHKTPIYTISGIPFLSVNNLRNNTISFDRCKYISLDEHTELTKRCKPEKGDVLLGKVGSIGVCDVVTQKQEFSIFVQLALLKFNQNLLSSFYIKYSILSETLKNQISQGSAGSALQYIGIGTIQSIITPLPPLAEQKRIVAKVERLMALCDELEARQEKQHKRILHLGEVAISQLLTPSTPETFNQHWQGICDNFDLLYSTPENVSQLRAEITSKVTDGEHITPERTVDGYYLLSARNIQDQGIILGDVDYVAQKEFDRIRKRCDPDKNDILISCSGSIGRVAIVDEDNTYVMVRSVALLKPLHNYLYSQYLALILKSLLVQEQIIKKSKTSAQANLFLGKIKEIKIALPPLAEQNRIVVKVDQLMSLCDKLEAKLKQSVNDREKLMETAVRQVLAA